MTADLYKLPDRNDFVPTPLWTVHDESTILTHFPFLSGECLRAALELEFDYKVRHHESEHIDTEQIRKDLEEELTSYALLQLSELCAAAHSEENHASKTRRLLWLILLHPEKLPDIISQECKHKAAESLRNIRWKAADPEALSAAAACLTRRMNFEENVRMALLSVFMNISTNEATNLDQRKIGEVLTEALLLELSRPEYLQSVIYSTALMKLMEIYKYPAAAEVLNVIRDSHWSEELRQLAEKTLLSLNESLDSLWLNATATKAEARTLKQLTDAIELSRFDASFIQLLFACFKGQAVGIKNDRRKGILYRLFTQNDERIRLAACYAFIREATSFDNALASHSLSVLAHLAVTSSSRIISDESVVLLNWLKENRSDLADILARNCAEASLAYVESFTHTAQEKVHGGKHTR